jgi:hypothetical protein
MKKKELESILNNSYTPPNDSGINVGEFVDKKVEGLFSPRKKKKKISLSQNG